MIFRIPLFRMLTTGKISSEPASQEEKALFTVLRETATNAKIPISHLFSNGQMILLVFAKDDKEARTLRQVLCWNEAVPCHWAGEVGGAGLAQNYGDQVWFDQKNHGKKALGLAEKNGWILLRSDGVVMEKGALHEISRLGECLLSKGMQESGDGLPQGKPLYVRTHLGLGDLIICQAIFRNLSCISRRPIHIFTKPKLSESVRFLCRDVSNLKIMEMDDPEVETFLRKTPLRDQVIIGHDFLPFFLQQKLAFDEAFYEIAGLKFSRRWADFAIRRDPEAEKRIFNHFGVREGDYVFLHDDALRNLRVDRASIRQKNLQVVEPKAGLTKNAFDYLYLMEHAREIHCIDSCFRLMADSVFSPRPGLYFHQNLQDGVQKDTQGLFSSSRLTWNVI